jgi:outer membrane protein TolC
VPILTFREVSAAAACTTLVVVVLLVLTASGSAALAAEPSPGRPLALSGALVETLERDPGIHIAVAELQAQRGLQAEAGGAFDLASAFNLTFRRSRGELLPTLIEAEEQRRDLFRIIISEFTRISDDLERQLEEDGPPIADCRGAVIVIDGRDICLTGQGRITAETIDEMLRRMIAGSEPGAAGALEILRQQQLDMHRQLTQNVIFTLRREVASAEDALEKLGVVPEIEQEYTIDFDLRVQKLTRTGFAWAVGVQVDSLQDNYDGKSLIPALGGKGIPNMFRSFAGVAVHVPLWRGRGRVAVAASERAAEEAVWARRNQAVHRVSESLLATSQAYWQLLAAQRRHELLQEAAETSLRLSESAEALIAGDVIPAVTRVRIQARQATLAQSVLAAELEREKARMALTRAIGQQEGTPETLPRATGELPEVTPSTTWAAIDSAALAARAQQMRFDLRGFENLQAGANVLLEASRTELRPQLDFNLAVGYSGMHQSFQDRYYDPRAFGEALFGRQSGPSVFFGLQFDVPPRNRVAAARVTQSAAFVSQSAVRTTELRRSIGSRVASLVSQLESTAAEVARRREAVEHRQAELDAAFDRFSFGEGTIIETIFSEESLTFASLDLLEAELAYALLSSQLEHELGELVTVEAANGALEVAAMAPGTAAVTR